MTIADKLVLLRRQRGWSQEELAEKMEVSRQAVSKWESAQAVPDLERILMLSRLFGVTTDYLLRDELEERETPAEPEAALRRVMLEEARSFLAWRRVAAPRIALATFLCILAVIPLLILCVGAETSVLPITEELGAALGLGMLVAIVAVAVVIFLLCGFRSEPWEFLEKEIFLTERGVSELVKEEQTAYRPTYVRCNVIATCISILSPIPLLVGAFFLPEFQLILMLSLTFLLAGIAVAVFIVAGVRWESMRKLLQEGDYTAERKRRGRLGERIAPVYWSVATAGYLAWSFLSSAWEITWVVWPIAAVLYVAVQALCEQLAERHRSHGL